MSTQKEGAEGTGDHTEGEHLGERCLRGREEDRRRAEGKMLP